MDPYSQPACVFLFSHSITFAFLLPTASNMELLYSTVTYIFSVQAFLFITSTYSLITRSHINLRQTCTPPWLLGLNWAWTHKDSSTAMTRAPDIYHVTSLPLHWFLLQWGNSMTTYKVSRWLVWHQYTTKHLTQSKV